MINYYDYCIDEQTPEGVFFLTSIWLSDEKDITKITNDNLYLGTGIYLEAMNLETCQFILNWITVSGV